MGHDMRKIVGIFVVIVWKCAYEELVGYFTKIETLIAWLHPSCKIILREFCL